MNDATDCKSSCDLTTWSAVYQINEYHHHHHQLINRRFLKDLDTSNWKYIGRKLSSLRSAVLCEVHLGLRVLHKVSVKCVLVLTHPVKLQNNTITHIWHSMNAGLQTCNPWMELSFHKRANTKRKPTKVERPYGHMAWIHMQTLTWST